jgi:hypothetical protein
LTDLVEKKWRNRDDLPVVQDENAADVEFDVVVLRASGKL